ncbi:IclR family transcriptional regulator [Amycolatopsis pigmentata]|uniref:IclR family transcriptional regulator n=1 Tax=Amycolatopsis pigmentata TaxID=450801 RepID=A0ABW5FVJ8_9PSEU
MRKSGPQVLRSAEHALRVVMLVAARGSVTVSEVAAELSVGVSTAHRLLATCKHAGFVRQDRAGGPYLIGPAIHELTLATTAAVSLKDAGGPVLRDLRDEIGETTSMLILEGRNVRFVESLAGRGRARLAAPRVGAVLPAHCTSGGKAMLSCLPGDELRRRLPGQRLEGVSERSIRTWPALAAELTRIQRRGWAANIGEASPSIGAVGAAIRSGTGEPRAAVVVAAPLSRLGTAPELSALAPAVMAAAARVQERLRGAPGD